jgi:hypothetical protein
MVKNELFEIQDHFERISKSASLSLFFGLPIFGFIIKKFPRIILKASIISYKINGRRKKPRKARRILRRKFKPYVVEVNNSNTQGIKCVLFGKENSEKQ